MSVTVVCGPPGAGKTTYVSEHTTRGDLVLDVDALYVALSGQPPYEKPLNLLPYVLEARDAVVGCLEHRRDVTAWVIVSGASAEERQALRDRLGAEVVVLETSAAECVRRIGNDERRSDQVDAWEPLVLRWWLEYEPMPDDLVVRE